jgi:hypothetical protein
VLLSTLDRMWLKVNTLSSDHLFRDSIWSQGVVCLSEAVYTLFVSKTTSARQPRRRESSNLCEYLCTKPASSTICAEEPDFG